MPAGYQWYDRVTMTVDVRSLVANVPETFDFDSQAGILFLLRAIRLSAIDQANKNTLKDSVFLYNTGTKDAALKQKLAQSLADFGVTPAIVAQEAAKVAIVQSSDANSVVPTSGFSGGRLAPVFIPVPVLEEVSSTKTASTSTVAPSVPTFVAPVSVETNIPIRKIAAQVSQPLRPVIPRVAEPRIVTVAVPTTTPVVNQTPVEVVAPVKSPELVIVTAPVLPKPELAELPVGTDEATLRMERIRTIKSTVNDRIGNPVNLVDVDNALGREYMSALLEAMKLLSSASKTESTQAMNRLERVYEQVILLLDTLKEQEQARVQPKVEVLTPSIETVPVPADTPIIPIAPILTASVSDVQITPTDAPTVERITPVARIVPVMTPVASNFAVRSKVVEKPQTVSSVPKWGATDFVDTVQPFSNPEVISSVASVVTQPDETLVHRMSTPPAEPLRLVNESTVASYQPEIVQSVTDQATPLRSISELKTADEVSAIEAIQNNPLYTKDVDAGLEQLLCEWTIFKKSGLFGTGPKGREHPLYVKISAMHLPLILAGRFEGSTQEIKQSITDYMNGWRYEQGIVYDQGETLDQYLRRVIRHIIDLQKSKRRS